MSEKYVANKERQRDNMMQYWIIVSEISMNSFLYLLTFIVSHLN